MKVWRKVKDAEGNSLLEPVDVSTIDTSKPIIFALPTREAVNGEAICNERAAGTAKRASLILGIEEENPQAEVLVVTYDGDTSHHRRLQMNLQMDNLHDKDAFVQEYLRPLIAKNANISMFGLSYGSVFAEAVRAAYIRQERQQGVDDKIIGNALRNIYIIMVANISRATSPHARNRDNNLDYSGIFFSFSNDITAHINNPGFRFSIPKGHKKDNVTIAPLPGNRIHVITHSPKEMIKQETEGKWVTIARARTNHVPEFMLLEDDPIGLYPMVERALTNAIYRQGTPSANDLLTQKPMKDYAPSTAEVMSLPERADALYEEAYRPKAGWRSKMPLPSSQRDR